MEMVRRSEFSEAPGERSQDGVHMVRNGSGVQLVMFGGRLTYLGVALRCGAVE